MSDSTYTIGGQGLRTQAEYDVLGYLNSAVEAVRIAYTWNPPAMAGAAYMWKRAHAEAKRHGLREKLAKEFTEAKSAMYAIAQNAGKGAGR